MDLITKEGLNCIRLESLTNYFSLSNLKFLANLNLNYLGDLFEFADQPEFFNCFKADNYKKQYIEIVGSIRVLQCKHLGLNPNINDASNEIRVGETALRMGFKDKTRKELLVNRINTNRELFDLVKGKGFRENRMFSESTINELTEKCNVVLNFNNVHSYSNIE